MLGKKLFPLPSKPLAIKTAFPRTRFSFLPCVQPAHKEPGQS